MSEIFVHTEIVRLFKFKIISINIINLNFNIFLSEIS